jgi:hypothetical protein
MTTSPADLQNPFCLEPIRLEAQFFGREQEIRRVLRFLHKEQSVSIVGPAGLGKTSFLLHVARPSVRAKEKLAEDQVFVYFDCDLLAEFEQGECYLYIREGAIRQIKSMESVDKAVGTELERAVRKAGLQTAYFGLRTMFQVAQENDLRLVVVLDNFESLARNTLLDWSFYSSLRGLPNNYRMAYLVASQLSMYELEHIRIEASPFFNIFVTVPLDQLNPAESSELVCTSLRRVPVEFPDFVIGHILDLGGNRPDRLQRAGYVAFQLWQENGGSLRSTHCREISRRVERCEV